MESNGKEDHDPKKGEDEEIKALNNNIVKEIPCKRDTDINLDKYRNEPKGSYTNIFLLVCIAGVSLGILLEIVNVTNRSQKFSKESCIEKNKYWIYSREKKVADKNGVLKHVHLVLERVGLAASTNATPWTLLWAHPHPFSEVNLRNLTANQRVNHFPGTGFITYKLELATTASKYIPKAFQLPKNKNEFFEYASTHQNTLFIQKSNKHRKVYVKNVSDIDVTSGSSFVQEFMQKPYLVDGHKFDIGVYVVLTSVNPLRVYWYKGDVLFRFCPGKYYPFDPKNLNKYVVGDDYLPIWEVPSLANLYTALGNTMKESFDIYVKSKGKDTTDMWEDIRKAIAEVFLMKEHHIIKALKQYSSHENFFEMMRFDFVVDEDLKVYLLEANMSPNLSSGHFPSNQLLYEQVLYNMFSLTGVTRRASVKSVNLEDAKATKDMVSTQKNIGVFGEECSTTCKDNCESLDLCYLCRPCLDPMLKKSLLAAHGEFLHRGDFRRLIPPSMVPHQDKKKIEGQVKNLSPNNKLLHLWYQGKCNNDITWCT